MSAVKLDILGGITIDPHIDLGETVALTYGARRFVGPLIHLDGNHGPVLAVCACPAHGGGRPVSMSPSPLATPSNWLAVRTSEHEIPRARLRGGGRGPR